MSSETQYDSPSETESSPLKPRILSLHRLKRSADSTLNIGQLDMRQNNVITEEIEREL